MRFQLPSFGADLSRRGFLQAGLAVGATAAVSSWNSVEASNPKVLNYLSWPGNADPYLVAEFEKIHGVKVRVKEYVGGDQMLALLNQSPPGSFDVILADAEYMHFLHEGNYLEELNPQDYALKDFWPEFQKFPLHWFNDKLYGVMTDFGYLGLSYNTKAFTAKEVESYAVLWSEKAKGKVGMFDWYLPAMGTISQYTGHKKPFDLTDKELKKVSENLYSLKPRVNGFFTIADIFSSLTNERVLLVPGIGEWITLGLRNNGVPVDTILPKEGGLQWTESLSIAKGSSKQDLARKFIQYTTSPEGQVRMATKPDNMKSIPSIEGWKLLNKTMPKKAEILRMQLNAPNVMDEYKSKKIAFRQLPSNQAPEDWNDIWSKFKGK